MVTKYEKEIPRNSGKFLTFDSDQPANSSTDSTGMDTTD